MASFSDKSKTNAVRQILLTGSADAHGLGPGRSYFVTKRIVDLFVSFLLLPFILPVIAVCGVALWIENPGPIFFAQQRNHRPQFEHAKSPTTSTRRWSVGARCTCRPDLS